MNSSILLKTRRTPSPRGRWLSRRLVLECLEDRVVPSIPDGTVLLCTGQTNPGSSSPIGIIGVNPQNGSQFPVSINSSQDGNLFNLPTYVIEAPDGQLYVTDIFAFTTGAIIRVDPNTGQQTLVTKGQHIQGPNTLAWVNGELYVACEGSGSAAANGTVHTIVQVDPTTGAQALITDGSTGGFTVPTGMEPGPGNTVYVSDEPGNFSGTDPGGVWQVNLSTGQQALITHDNLINHPVDLGQDQNGNLLTFNVVSSPGSQPETVIRVNPANPDPTNGTNQSLIYQQQNSPYAPDGITENLNTGVIYIGCISYGANPAVLLALTMSGNTATQTVVTSGGQLDEVEGIRVYHPVVQTAASSTTVSSSNSSATVGQAVTWTATVTPASGSGPVPTGTVQFTIDGTPFGSPLMLSASGTATTASDNTLSAGTHTITATYSGDSTYNGSSGSFVQTIATPAKANSSTTVSSSNPSATVGQAVSWTATVSGSNGTPTGTVQFTIDGSNFGSPVTLSGGTATSLSDSTLTAGTHTITATYSGDNTYNGSSGLLAGGQVVQNQTGSSSTVVTSSANPSVYGQSVTFTATITGSGNGTPTGTVQFQIDGNSIGGSVAVTTSRGITTASLSTSTLSAGTHPVTAVYNGDSHFTSSSGSASQTVNRASTSTLGNSSASSLVPGQSVTVSATVSVNAPGSGTPTGTVDFYDTTAATDLGSVPLSSSNASLPVTDLPLGNNTITLSYSGDSNFLASSTLLTIMVTQPVVVNPSVLILDPTADGALTVSGNATINVTGSIVVNSNSSSALTVNGNPTLTAASIPVVGNVHESGHPTFSPAPVTGAAAVADPLANLAPPSTSGMTNYGAAKITGNSTQTLQPGIYSEITISGKASVTLSPGVYLIEGGGFTVSGNASVTGTGILIYNTGSKYPNSGGTYGAIKLSGNSTVELSPATSGVYAGVVIDQDPNDTQTVDIGSDISLASGWLYAPKAPVVLSGHAQFTGSLDVDLLTLSGNAADNATGPPPGGGGAQDVGGPGAEPDLSPADALQSAFSAAVPVMNGPAIPETALLSVSSFPQSLTRPEVQDNIDYLFANSLEPGSEFWLSGA
jgi:hypothetical protein